MEQMQRTMEEALHNIADNTRRGDNQGGREVNQYSSFKDFMDTKPPVFKEALEPLEANEWIYTMEQKFRLLRMTEELKAEYAAHQLRDPLGFGGPITVLPTQRGPQSPGTASPPRSGEIIFLRVWWK